MNLTERQHEIIAFAGRDLPLGLREDFTKYVLDCLRPKRIIENTDVTYFCAAALHKFNNKTNGQNQNECRPRVGLSGA